MDPIHVVWFGSAEKLWKNCTVMLCSMLDSYECIHYFGDVPEDIPGAVVILHGEHCAGQLEKLQLELNRLQYVVLIYLGDECQTFPVESIKHPNMKLWVQDADWRRVVKIDRYLPGGYAPGCSRRDVPRNLDWFWAGQSTHSHRLACVEAMMKIPGGGFFVHTRGYTEGISSEEYYRCLSRAKFAPCPSGPRSPDSTRVWEALECNSIPLVDASSPERPEGFWDLITPNAPFPVIRNWDELPTLLPKLLDQYESLSVKVADWWASYKKDYRGWLKKDTEELRAIL